MMHEVIQDVAAGRLQALYERQKKLFAEGRFVRRLWSKDISLWPVERAREAEIRGNLNWLDLPAALEPLLRQVAQSGRSAVEDRYTSWVFLALGSSSLAARSILPLSEKPPECPMTILDTCHPSAIRRVQDDTDLSRTLFVLANKAGDKLEDHALFFHFQKAMESIGLPDVSRHFVSLTASNTFLANLSRGYIFRASILDPPDIPSAYSSLLHFGALLTATSALDPESAAAAAAGIAERISSESPENPAFSLGCFLAAVATAQCRFLVFLCAASLAPYSDRLGHLIGGSIARENSELIPICGRVPSDTTGYEERAAFVFLTRAGDPDPELAKKMTCFRSSGIPFVQIEISTAPQLLAETFRWEFATALACAGLGVLPFDLPGVRHPRRLAMDLLEHLPAAADALERKPRIQDQGIQLFVEGRTRPELSTLNLIEACRSFFRLTEHQSFVAILVFLELTPELQDSVHRIREQLTRRLGVPVLVAYGPRSSDNYGYLWRTFSPAGMFIVLTADYPVDLPVPGAGYSFSQLHKALSLGEFESLAQSEKFTIRFNLTGDPSVSLGNLERAFEQALPRKP